MSDVENPTKSQDVERIRDIIFGNQMRDYQQRFDVLQRDLERLQQSINNLSEQLADQDSSQGKKIQSLRKELQQTDENLLNELRETTQNLTQTKVERQQLGQMFIELGNRLTQGGSVSDLLEKLVNDEVDTQRDG